MSGFHVLTPSWTSGATITANFQINTAVAASQLLTVQPSRFWRSTTKTGVRFTIDAGSSKPWNTLTFLYHNLYAATGSVRSDDNSANLFGTPAFNTGTVNLLLPGDLGIFGQRGKHSWIHTPTIQTSRYIGFEINDGTNPDTFLQAGVVLVGVDFESGIGADLGARFGRDDPSQPIRMLNGEAVVRPKRGSNVGNWTFPGQTLDEAMHWYEIQYNYGSKIPIVTKWDPVSGTIYQQHLMIYGYAQWRQGGAVTYTNGKGRYTVEMGMIEL